MLVVINVNESYFAEEEVSVAFDVSPISESNRYSIDIFCWSMFLIFGHHGAFDRTIIYRFIRPQIL
jgi:hypothetical protein